MWAELVVVLAPLLDDLARLGEAAEQCSLEALVTEATVEAFYESVLYRLAGMDESELHGAALGPRVERLRRELRPLVHYQGSRPTALGTKSVEHPHQTASGQRRVYLDGQALACDRLSWTAAGVAAGLVASFGLLRFLGTLLYGVRPIDPMVLGTVSLILVSVALGASYLPARRASRVDPVAALRQ